ncbi:MAG TPA: hypothetical protein VHC96_13310 [Puia sp.]|nr:hypothetical protein [Puia sp.]
MERLLTQKDFTSYMEKAISELSASRLRKLLNDEIKNFIDCLDNGSIEDLEKKKEKLKEIYKQLAEKELLEMAPIIWGRNTSRNNP